MLLSLSYHWVHQIIRLANHQLNFSKKDLMRSRARFTSLAAFSSAMSARTTQPWAISGNSTVPDWGNLWIKFSITSPPVLTFAGSFPAGSKKTGHRILLERSSSFPPNIPSIPKEGWGPAMAMNPSNLAERRKACHVPQQNPMAKNCLIPFDSIKARTFSNLLYIASWSRLVKYWTMAGPGAGTPSKIFSNISGRKTLYLSEAKRSAILLCLPL